MTNLNKTLMNRATTSAIVLLATLLPAILLAEQDLEELQEQAVKSAVSKVAKSVVRIETFGGLEKVGRMLVGTGPTTGLAVSEDGFILSSAFNFIQQPSSILITLPSGKRAAAEIVARDSSRMLVLLKVNSDEKLVVPESIARGTMTVGQLTIAVGRTFDQNQPNISVGILSATNRIWGKAIQSDAKISPSNYGGPLVDIHGRVLGILVPMSPQGKGEVAGAEWYDSGIGFAVPLEDINRHLDKMMAGEDLFAGIMGISLKGTDIYSDEALVAAVPAKSPAAEAGIKPGDKVIEVDGAAIVRQAQLKHALGGKYAGDTVQVVVLRGEERLEKSIELTDKLIPYEHPFLGVLPMRDADVKKGIVVRFVYPGSPAQASGIETGDHLISLDANEIVDIVGMQEMLATHEPGAQVQLKLLRNGEKIDVELDLSKLPVEIPEQLPPAYGSKSEKADVETVGVVEIKIPEEQNSCIVYIPDNYRAERAHGLLVWIHEPGGFDQEKVVSRWKKYCEEFGLILLSPQSADPKRWRSTEVEFIRKTIDDVLANYNVDRSRVVVHGHQAGGSMAYLAAFGHRELVRGVAVVDAALPRRMQPPSNDPIQRLAIYSASASKSKLAEVIKAGNDRLGSLKFPVTTKNLGFDPRYLNENEIKELVRWIDTLDRI